jgi:hypothetical protein
MKVQVRFEKVWSFDMADMASLMPVLARLGGHWVGTYRHMNPDGVLEDTYEVRCHSEFPTDGEADYRLSTHNIWADGRETRAVHLADYRDGLLWWRGALTGWMKEVDDRTVYLRFGFEEDPSVTVCEMIQVSQDGQHRARTWHWFRDEVMFRITLTKERRPSAPAD